MYESDKNKPRRPRSAGVGSRPEEFSRLHVSMARDYDAYFDRLQEDPNSPRTDPHADPAPFSLIFFFHPNSP